MTSSFGTGPGVFTADGCAVEVYARLPPAGEPELVHEQLAVGASVLDLGAGVGRIADPLADMGHRVVAVDDSRDMLSRVRRATTVHASIEGLQLSDRFDAALLASFLINTPDSAQRRDFLTTARHHVLPGGAVFVQWHPPEWFDALAPAAGTGAAPATCRGEHPPSRQAGWPRPSRSTTSATVSSARW